MSTATAGFAGTGHLVRAALRRDRLRVPVWVGALGGLTYATAAAQENIYDTPEAVASYAALVGASPVTVAFAGPPLGLDTIEGIIVFETSFTVVVGVSLMAVMMISRHTRGEEESGRSELVRATEVGRHALAAAALLVTGLACLLVGAAVAVALLPSALSAHSSVVFGAGMALLGLVHAAITLCLAQAFVHARTVTGAGLAVVVAGYVVRAAGDVREDWLVWLSPTGWVQAAHVPTEDRWWPYVVPVVATGLLLGLAVALAERRDFGGGLLPSRPGRPEASRWLAGPAGLAWRAQRGAVLGWGTGLLATALITGTLSEAMTDMVEQNPAIADYLELTSGGSVIDSYLATMVLILALSVGGFAVWAAGHTGAEEQGGQLDLLLAAPVGRARARLAALAVTAVSTTLVLLTAGAGLLVSQTLVTGSVADGLRALGAQLAYLPAVLTLVGVVALVDGWLPRWTWVGWAMLTYFFVIGWLGGLLDPPRWAVDLSLFSHTPRVPVESAGGWELPLLLAATLALVAGGLVGLRRRDIAVG